MAGIAIILALVMLTNGIDTLKDSIIPGIAIIIIAIIIGYLAWILLLRALGMKEVVKDGETDAETGNGETS